MKVLYLLDSLNRGGTETIVLDICRNAGSHGLEVTLVASGDGDLEQEFRSCGVDFLRLRRRMPIDPFIVRSVRRVIREKDISVVHGFQPVEALHLALAARGLSAKTIITHGGFIQGWKNRLTGRIISRYVDANISVSRALLPWLQSELGIDTEKNFHVIWNAVDGERLSTVGRSIRSELGIGGETCLVGMTANFRGDGTKDQLTVCRALKRVRDAGKDARLLFAGRFDGAGSSEYLQCLEFCRRSGIEDKVHFLGPRNDIASILDELDLFVFSSRMEGLSLAVAEAMIKGVPVIVSAIEPLLEATCGDKFADVFDVGDDRRLADLIIAHLDDPADLLLKAKAASGYAMDHFTISSHIERLKGLYAELASSG